jgi:catechol 2,3-dioxygenase-like lactoylglutathione lyase family enzyme
MHLVLAVGDVERSKQFYGRVFGWKPHLEWPGTYSELELGDNDWLGLYRRDGFAAEAGAELADGNGGRHRGAELYVLVDDLDRAIERLRQADAEPLSERALRVWGHEAAYFADPDGYVVAVARPIEATLTE